MPDLTSKELNIRIRMATLDDMAACKKIADEHRHALGFLPKPVFSEAVERNTLLISEIGSGDTRRVVGFVRYNHRKRDRESVIYDICVAKGYKQQHIGHALVSAVIEECHYNHRESLILRCPEDLPANKFYERVGFERDGIQAGRSRRLVVWRYIILSNVISHVSQDLGLRHRWQKRKIRRFQMQFVASATLKRHDWRGLMNRWDNKGTGPDPFRNLILTPLPGLSERSTVEFVKKHFVGRSCIWFDSGGYFVQQGKIEYEELYGRLLQWYCNNRWADVYILPDYVPSSDLSEAEVEERVWATIAVARQFSADLPDELRQKALPVVQGHTREQILACVETYLDLGYEKMGFGSFDTTGAGKDINLLTRRALSNLEFLQELAAHYGFKTHAFGIGSPALIPTLYELGVHTFDSSCWIRTAGYGNVLLPFLSRRNVSHGMLREVGGRAYSATEFAELKAKTEHECPFCDSFERLQKNRLDQAMHNLLVIHETVAALERGVETLSSDIQEIIKNSRYNKMRSKNFRF